jgi:H+/Na+-translocating ferredoxin:NAD+ oxidoreductase subunit B
MTDKRRKTTVVLNTDLTGFNSAKTDTPAHHIIMKRFASPLLGGPPPSDDLLEMVVHMFTEDEAFLVRHLPLLWARTAAKVSRESGRPVSDVASVLDHLAYTKKVILAVGNPTKYSMMPIIPGVFEAALMTVDLSSINAWHKKFAELFETLWESGFSRDYNTNTRALVRYLPVSSLKETLHRAWPSDMLEAVLEPYDAFAVGHCQCRLSMNLTGKGCGKPMENCVSMGPVSKLVAERGMMRRIDKQEVVAIKRNAEEQGCVTWMINANDLRFGTGSCSCCGCCCHALRSVSEFSVPGLISKPHFMPKTDFQNCNLCGKCEKICPMDARIIADKQLYFDPARCIGCGLCAVSCKSDAIALQPVAGAKRPERNWPLLLAKMLPGYVSNSIAVFAKRYFA